MERGGTANGSGALIGSSGSGERKRGRKKVDSGRTLEGDTTAAASPGAARPPG